MIVFRADAWRDYLAWQREEKGIERINALIEECARDPFRGTGKPEPLRQNLRGWWSRRITGEHRLVYRVRGSGETQALEILSCRYHYRSVICRGESIRRILARRRNGRERGYYDRHSG